MICSMRIIFYSKRIKFYAIRIFIFLHSYIFDWSFNKTKPVKGVLA